MKKQLIFYFILLSLLVIIGCKNTSEEKPEITGAENTPILNLPDNEAGEIVKNAIDYAGGYAQWEKMKTLSYKKNISFYDSLGNKTLELSQLHQYQLQPTFKSRISWEEDDDKYEMINNGEKAWKLKNGEVQTTTSDSTGAWNSTFGSHYVMCMPFKLADPGTILSLEGIDTLDNGQKVYSVKADYEKNAGSSGGLHMWWYYFDASSYEPIANFLDYGDGYSYTQYTSFVEVNGIKLNKERKSYRTNKEMEMLSLASVYTNSDIQFNTEFDKDLFEGKKK